MNPYQLLKGTFKMTDYLNEIYDKMFNIVYHDLMDRRKNDPNFTKQKLQELLESLYVNAGNNWGGRGETKESEIDATIAAYEAVLYDWTE